MDVSVIAAIRSQRTSAKWRAYPADTVAVWIAEMDFSLAPCVAQALHQAIDDSDTGYRWPGELPEALADFVHRHFAWQIAPEHVFTLPDVLTGMAEAMRRFTRAGQSVVITPPVYPPFFNVTRAIAEREVVEVPVVDGCLDLESLEAAFARPEVAAFLMCHPHNPTGYCAPVEVLRSVAALARKYDVTVISDEIWAPLSWDETPFVPYLSFDPELTAPDVALVSASKAFNLAGLKCAQLVAGSAETAEHFRKTLPMEITYGTGHLGIIASIAAYRNGDGWLAQTKQQLQDNTAHLVTQLGMAGLDLSYQPATSTYLAWLDCRHLGFGDDPAKVFLDRGRVALNAGHLFGMQGRGFVRFNCATTPEVISEAVSRMACVVSDS